MLMFRHVTERSIQGRMFSIFADNHSSNIFLIFLLLPRGIKFQTVFLNYLFFLSAIF